MIFPPDLLALEVLRLRHIPSVYPIQVIQEALLQHRQPAVNPGKLGFVPGIGFLALGLKELPHHIGVAVPAQVAKNRLFQGGPGM